MIKAIFSRKNNKKKKYTFVILNYNSFYFLKKCIKSIENQSNIKQNIFEVLILDNGSVKPEIDLILDYLYSVNIKNISLFYSSKNLGFAKGNNELSKKSNSEYLIFLNSDTILSKNYLKEIDKHSLDLKKNICGGNMRNFNGKELLKYNEFMSIDLTFMPCKHKFETYIDGANLIIRKSTFLKLGMFDEMFFIYQEDVDLCLRALLSGFSLLTIKSADFKHYGTGSLKSEKNINYKKLYLSERNSSIIIFKIMGKLYIFFYFIFYLLILRTLLTIFLLPFNFQFSKCLFSANFYIIKNMKKILKKRKIFLKKKVKNDFYILRLCKIYPSRFTQLSNRLIQMLKN